MLRSQGAEITLPPGAGAEIMNCGSGSFLFTTDLKKFYRKKIKSAEEVFVIVTSLILLLKSKKEKVNFNVLWRILYLCTV